MEERTAIRGAVRAGATARAQTSTPEISRRQLLLLLLLLLVNTVTLAMPVATKQAGPRRTREENSERSDSAETSASRWKLSGSNERRKLRLELPLKPSRAQLRPMNICAPGSG